MAPGTPCEAPTDGYTQRDIWRKPQVEGSLLMRPGGSDWVSASRIAEADQVGRVSGGARITA